MELIETPPPFNPAITVDERPFGYSTLPRHALSFFDDLLFFELHTVYGSVLLSPIGFDYLMGTLLPFIDTKNESKHLQTLLGSSEKELLLKRLLHHQSYLQCLSILNVIRTEAILKDSYFNFLNTYFPLTSSLSNQRDLETTLHSILYRTPNSGIDSKMAIEQNSLLNICSFSLSWDLPFDPSLTIKETFVNSQGRHEKWFVHQTGFFFFYENDFFSYVEIPMEKGKFSFNCLLPKKKYVGSPKKMESFMEEAKSKGSIQLVSLMLPKLHIRYCKDLAPFLREHFTGLFDLPEIGSFYSIIQVTSFDLSEGGLGQKDAKIKPKFQPQLLERAHLKAFHAQYPYFFSLETKDQKFILVRGYVGS